MDKFIKFILSWEGGFVNDPRDSGGATNKGVTIATFRQVFGKDKTVQDLKNITEKLWETIFKMYYWNRWRADSIKNEWLRYLLVDWVWASGKYGITKVLRYLKVEEDGIVGDNTINALNSLNPELAFKDIWHIREQFLYNIAKGKNSVFLKGWLRRLNGIRYGMLITNKNEILK